MGLSLCRQLFGSNPFSESDSPTPPSRDSLFTPLSVAPSMRLTTILLHSPPVGHNHPLGEWSTIQTSRNMHVCGGTVWRQLAEQSSDATRSREGVRTGLHLWHVCWLVEERGSHALLGVSTNKSPLRVDGYTAVVGGDSQSWGWELSTNQLWHEGKEVGMYPVATAERHHHLRTPNGIPDRVGVVLDADAGTLGYMVEGCYLGVAFSGLPKGEELFLTVSSVRGKSSMHMHYLGGMSRDPPSLMSLSRVSINQALGRSRVAMTDELPLPPVLKDYMQETHQWRVNTKSYKDL